MQKHPKQTRPCLASMALLAALALCLVAAPAAAASRYIFAVFKGDSASAEKLSIYTSTDGLNFKLLSDTGYGGPTGVLRDPSIMKHSDGKYYIAHTIQSWDTNSSAFAIAASSDLVKWTAVTTVDAQVANVAHTWAPEWFKDSDGSVNIVVSIDVTTTSASFRAYRFTATDDTLTKWSGPTAVGIGPNNIDTFIVKSGSTYHAFSKNESTKYIEHATATSVNGPWTWVGKDDWAGWGSGKEGPALFQLANGGWRIIMDKYSGGGCLYADSTNLDKWSATSEIPGGLSGVVRHGTVLREDDLPDGGTADTAVPDVAPDVPPLADARDGRPGADAASGTGGVRGSGGAGGATRTAGTGGAVGSGGAASQGGTTGSGGRSGGGGSGSGGTPGSGGTVGSGGVVASGGAAGSGGSVSDAASVERRDSSRAGGSSGSDGNADAGQGCACAVGKPAARHQGITMLLLGLLALVRRRRE